MYEMKLRVRLSETDENGKLSKSALINYFQDIATMQSEDCGYGLDWLMKEKKGWFVTSWRIHINRMPKMGDYISVQTYPYKIKGFFGFRDFVIVDNDGNTIAMANSEWIYMDHESGNPSRVPAQMAEKYDVGESIGVDWPKGKINPFDNEIEIESQKVPHTFVDYNGHMNNVYHLEMAETVLDDYGYNTIRIDYRMQVKENENIHLCLSKNDGKEIVSIKNSEGKIYAILEYSNTEIGKNV